MRGLKISIYIFFGILISFVLYLIFRGDDESYFTDYKIFNESEIYGKITYVGVKYHAANFKVNNDSAGYIFHPISGDLNGGHTFTNFAKIGDTIIKMRFSDTLILKKDFETFKYTFIKGEK